MTYNIQDDFDAPTAPNRKVPTEVQVEYELHRVARATEQTAERLALTNVLLGVVILLLMAIAYLIHAQRPVTAGELADLYKSDDKAALAKRQLDVPVTNVRGTVFTQRD